MRLKEKAKRVLATVMALSMMFSSMSTAVFATGTEPTPPEGELIVEQTQQSTVTVNWGETPAESISPSLTLSFTTGAEGETPVVQELTAEENWTATYQLPYSETAYTLTVSGVPEGFAAAVSAVEGGYAVSIAAAEAQQQSEEQPETPTADPVQELYDTLMAFESYDELSDYMDNMTEEQYALLSQFSEEQTAALQAHTQTLSENAQEMLPEVNETELNKVKRELPNKLMQHLDVRLPGASITITTELVDYISGTTISTGVPRTIAAQVNQVHSITLTNFYRYTRYGTQWENSYTYTDFERNVDAVIENRQNTNFYVTQNTTATVTVDLIDNDDNIYENVVLTYNYDGIARAAMNCDTYVKYDGSYYGGLDFNPATNTEFTSRYINYVIPVVKVWNDTGYEHLRPDDLTIKLQSSTSENGPWTDTGKTLTLNAANEWKGSFENLDYQNDSLQRIYYKVVEELPANSNYEQTGFDTIDDYIYVVGDNRPSIAAYRFTNTPTSVDIPVTKVWDDNNNQDGKRPNSIIVNLVEVGASTPTATIELTAANGWKGEFTNVDPSKEYTVTEENLPEGYTLTKVEGSNSTGYTVTNTLTPETVAITVNKVWKDKDGNTLTTDIPASMHFHLFKNGTMYGDEYVLSAANEWGVKIENLPKYEGGQAIVWTVGEHKVPALYEVVYTDNNTQKEMNRDAGIQITNNAGSVTITNTYDPNTKSIVVQKLWVGDEEHTDLRPASITVALYQKIGQDGEWKLYRNGESYEYGGETIDVITTLNNVGDWRYRWPNLPTHHTSTVDYFYGVAEVEEKNGTVTVINDKLVDGLNGAKYEVGYENNSNTNNSDSDNDIGQAAEGTVVITNTLRTRTLTVKKDWVGTIPSGSVTVDVYNSENEKVDTDGDSSNGITPLTLNASNSWEATTAALPANESYTVKENGAENGEVTIEGHTYTVSQSYNNANGIWTITNSEIIDIPVEKVWNDNSNAYGKRPSSITVKLMEGTTEVQSAVLNAANSWSYTFTDLLPGDYRVKEVIDSSWDEFYEEPVIKGDAANGYTITNTIKEDAVKVSLIINKTWYGDNAKIDWSKVKFLVRQNGTLLTENTDYTVTRPTSGKTGQIVITGLPKYDNKGYEYIYTIREDTSNLDGWVVSSLVQTATTEHIYSLVNTQTMRIGLRKIWDDNNNQDGLRPDKLTFTLYQNDDLFYSGSIDVSGDVYENMWINLPRFDANGKEYTYTVAEEPVEGYTTVSEKLTGESSYNEKTYNNDRLTFNNIDYYDVAYVAQFINTHNPETVDYYVSKTWIDNNNQDGKRPEKITIGAYVGTTLVKSVELKHDPDNNWEGVISDLPKYDGTVDQDGNPVPINYVIREVGTNNEPIEPGKTNANGYVVTYDGTRVINTYTPATTDITVTKVWEDANNQDGKRPETTAVKLMKGDMQVAMIVLDGTVDDNGETGAWKATFKDLPKYENGVEINYTVQEVGVSANNTITFSTGATYTVTTSVDELTGYTITNTYTPETTSVTVKKVWDDNNNQDGKRPNSITVYVMNGDKQEGTVILNKDNNWTATFKDLPKYNGTVDAQGNAVPIPYSVQEVGVSANNTITFSTGATYTVTTSGDTAIGYTITNTYTPETTDVTITKKWVGTQSGWESNIPESILVHLYANGNMVDTFPSAYADRVSEVNGHKVLELKKDDKSTTEENTWIFKIEGLPAYADGKRITYTVEEHGSYGEFHSEATGTTVVNTYTPGTVDVNVQKFWDDDNNRDGKRPSSIQVMLEYKDANNNWHPFDTDTTDGKDPEPVTLNAENDWRAVWSVDSNGTYRVVEIGVGIDNKITFSNGATYTAKYSYSDGATEESVGAKTVFITNTYNTPETTDVSGTKTWVDNDNEFGTRPDSINVSLYADGVLKQTARVSANADGEWKYSFTNLPKYASGKVGVEISYTVEEAAVPGYDATYSGYNITNTRNDDALINIPVRKEWHDNNNQDGIRPGTLTVNLFNKADANKAVIQSLTLTATNNWSGQFSDLPKYDSQGNEITYFVQEDMPNGYQAYKQHPYDTNNGGDADGIVGDNRGFLLLNEHTPETVSITVTKDWDDVDDQDGQRPSSVTIHLMANGYRVTGVAKTLTENGNWTATWDNLPKKANGVDIVYTVDEDSVAGYEKSYSYGTGSITFDDENEGKVTVTNKHVPETITISGTKTWLDDDDQYGLRPSNAAIKVILQSGEEKKQAQQYQVDQDGNFVKDTDGKYVLETVEPATANAANNWTYSFINLPKYEPNKVGVKIEYTVTDNVLNYTAEGGTVVGSSNDKQANLINRLTESVDLTVEKVWDDQDNKYGTQPTSIEVTVVGKGETTGKPVPFKPVSDNKENYKVILSADNNWKHTFENLPKAMYTYDEQGKITGSETIVYTVEETAVTGYVTTYKQGENVLDSTDRIVFTNDAATVTVRNTLETIDIDGDGNGPDDDNPLYKEWVDENNKYNTRPESITVKVMVGNAVFKDAAGNELSMVVKPDEDGKWAYKFLDLPKHDSEGKPIEYTVVDEATGYTPTAGNKENGYQLTNTLTTIEIKV
ncbi:MAG: Cna B-type domain-containing protein, partial [Oscillospiraceae bacterium]|nr:Cna B-type domain-containing protein [Oscillospiraceae bacterium]